MTKPKATHTDMHSGIIRPTTRSTSTPRKNPPAAEPHVSKRPAAARWRAAVEAKRKAGHPRPISAVVAENPGLHEAYVNEAGIDRRLARQRHLDGIQQRVAQIRKSSGR